MQAWLKVLLLIALFIIIFSLLTFYTSIRPPKIATNLAPADLGLKHEEVTFESADGLRLSGWLIPNNKSKSAIIVMHGYPADKANLLGIAEFLAHDFNVLLFDFRSFGRSEGKYTTAGYLERKDLAGAIEYLEKEKNFTKIGLYGFSLGGAVALMSSHTNVGVIVTDSAFAELSHIAEHMYRAFFIFKYPLAYLTKLYGLLFLKINIEDVSPLSNIKNANVPVLLIHAEKDSQIPVSEAYLLHNANRKSVLWIVKNAEHGMSHAINPEEYERRVTGFFREHLK